MYYVRIKLSKKSAEENRIVVTLKPPRVPGVHLCVEVYSSSNGIKLTSAVYDAMVRPTLQELVRVAKTLVVSFMCSLGDPDPDNCFGTRAKAYVAFMPVLNVPPTATGIVTWCSADWDPWNLRRFASEADIVSKKPLPSSER